MSTKSLLDDHGQPFFSSKANLENNISKAIDQLSGICAGILADGLVNDAEIKFFIEQVIKYAEHEPIWPFAEILSRIERILADGRIDEDEKCELTDIMSQITGRGIYSDPSQTYSSELPLDDPSPDTIHFEGNEFAVTGRFAYGTRKKVIEAIASKKGIGKDGSPSMKTRYLVIGAFASRDWYNTNYGRKIERAVELRASGQNISIISEEHWRKFIK